MNKIQSKKHKIDTYDIKIISLSCFDDKRYILNDGITTLAYFHKVLLIIYLSSKLNSWKDIKRI